MIVPVFDPPARIDINNIVAFRESITDLVHRFGAVIVDCSSLVAIGPSGMHILRNASRDATVTLMNPNPAVKLMAAAFGFDIQHEPNQASL